MKFKEKKQSSTRTIFSAAGFVFVIIGWFIFAPPAIGGQTSYIIIIGNSMEPDFYYGDLVLIHAADSYDIGNIVAYGQPEIGTIFHRITTIEDDYFTLKGDNNTWEDSYHPQLQEIIGKYWFHIPSAGKFFNKLRSPASFSLLVVIFAVVIIYTLSIEEKPGKLNKEGNKKIMSEKPDNAYNPSDWLYIISIIGFIALVLAFVSFTKPIETTVTDNYEYTHSGFFSYYSDVPDNIYEGNQLETGDPIFRQINDSVNIDFSYELDSDKHVDISGTYQLVAIIKDTTGWERSIEIIPLSLIQESSFTSSGVLDLNEVDEVIENFEEQTGVISKRYTLILQPQVTVEGEIGGRAFEDSFTPDLTFFLDEQKLTLVDDVTENGEILNPTSSGTVLGTKSSPNTISILGWKLNVLMMRIISIYMIGATVIALFVFNKNFGINPESNNEPGHDQKNK